MILDQKKTTFAYRCPSCGGIPTSMVGIFSISGQMFKLKCDCGGSFAVVEKRQDGKMYLSIPCALCANQHLYTVSQDLFFSSDIFMLPCPACGYELCFIGKEDKIAEAIQKSDEDIVKTLGTKRIENIKENKGRDLTDPHILEIVTYVVHELNDEGNIHCGCKPGEGDYECNIYDDFISVKCKKCHKSATIPADSIMAAYEFLNADQITLS